MSEAVPTSSTHKPVTVSVGDRPLGVVEAWHLLAHALATFWEPWLLIARIWGVRLAAPAASILLIIAYRHAYTGNSSHPARAVAGLGWWAWYDQGKMLEAAQAWSAGDFNPVHHWYLPTYPLLGAAFLHVSRNNPFFWPDLLGLLASLWLFIALMRTIGLSRPASALVFVLATACEGELLNQWVIPWNTSITTPLILLGLLSAVRLHQDYVRHARSGFWLGVVVGLLPSLRAADLVAILPPLLLVATAVLKHAGADSTRPLRARLLDRTLWRPIVAAAAGLGLALALFGLAYVRIYGLHVSGYLSMSSDIGFDIRLLLLHWVTLVIDPRPLFPDGAGMVQTLPWLAAGFIGALACVFTALAPRSGLLSSRHTGNPRQAAHGMTTPQRAIHCCIVASVALYWAVYLCYRDLHPNGLWVYNNIHYFKWTMPLLAGYAALLLKMLVTLGGDCWRRRGLPDRRIAPLLAAGVVVLLALCWRPELRLHPIVGDQPKVDAANQTVTLPEGLGGTRDALLIPASARESDIYLGSHLIHLAGRDFHDFSDFRAFPVPGGMMVTPLRPLPSGPATLVFFGPVHLVTTTPVLTGTQRLVFGLPCWVPRALRATSCMSHPPLPGPVLPLGRQIDFDGKMEPPFLMPGGWADQSNGRWTIGYHAGMQFRIAPETLRAVGDGSLTIEVEGQAFVPRGSGMMHVDVTVNGKTLTRWRISTTEPVTMQALVPRQLIPSDGEILLDLSVLDARRPSDYLQGSRDGRLLGMKILALRAIPAPTATAQ